MANDDMINSRNMDGEVSISTRLTERDFILFNFYILYRKPMMVLLTGLAMYMLFTLVKAEGTHEGTPWFALFFVPGMLIVIPALVFTSAKRRFKADARIREQMIYRVTKDEMCITGESFSTTFTLEKLHKVAENRKWILVWHNAHSANILPKRDIETLDLDRLRQFTGLKSR